MRQGFRLWLCALLFFAPAALGSEERRPRRLRKLRRLGRGAATPVKGGMCDDSCEDFAKNGRCDDGSAAIALPSSTQEHRIYCALGTDCSDCGSVPRRPPPAKLKEMMPQPGEGVPTEPLPPQGLTGIPLLRERKVEVHAAWTKTQPSFLMPYTDPREDFDVSENMHTKRAVEPLSNLYWHRRSQQVRGGGAGRGGGGGDAAAGGRGGGWGGAGGARGGGGMGKLGVSKRYQGWCMFESRRHRWGI